VRTKGKLEALRSAPTSVVETHYCTVYFVLGSKPFTVHRHVHNDIVALNTRTKLQAPCLKRPQISAAPRSSNPPAIDVMHPGGWRRTPGLQSKSKNSGARERLFDPALDALGVFSFSRPRSSRGLIVASVAGPLLQFPSRGAGQQDVGISETC
jgi:hypothetical protein